MLDKHNLEGILGASPLNHTLLRHGKTLCRASALSWWPPLQAFASGWALQLPLLLYLVVPLAPCCLKSCLCQQARQGRSEELAEPAMVREGGWCACVCCPINEPSKGNPCLFCHGANSGALCQNLLSPLCGFLPAERKRHSFCKESFWRCPLREKVLPQGHLSLGP